MYPLLCMLKLWMKCPRTYLPSKLIWFPPLGLPGTGESSPTVGTRAVGIRQRCKWLIQPPQEMSVYIHDITHTSTESAPRLLPCCLPFVCILETRFNCPVCLYKFITKGTFFRQMQSLMWAFFHLHSLRVSTRSCRLRMKYLLSWYYKL